MYSSKPVETFTVEFGLTLGAIGAALIAAAVSFVGLVLGKEQKTSEFRQEWINNLRKEISIYVTNVSAISDQVKLEFNSTNDKLKYLAPFYTAINSASNSIKLRLNPEEQDSKKILGTMDEIEAASQDDKEFSAASMHVLEDRLITESQALLKKEWKRVKSGESVFKVTKCFAGVLLLILVVLLAFATIGGFADRGDRSSKKLKQAETSIERNNEQPALPKPKKMPLIVSTPEATASNKRSN